MNSPAADRARIGIVGLGNMGFPMASRLVDAGFEVHGYDRDEASSTRAAVAGVLIADSAEAVAASADVIVLLLPNSDVVDAVAAQLAAAAGRVASVIVDMSSSAPMRTQALAARLAEAGIVLVDAPVSGGVRGAEAGTLTIMVGGSVEQIDSLAPIFDVLGSRVVRVGNVGAGHAVKALNNLLSATHLLATNEAVVVAARFGIDPELLLSAVNTSSGRSASSERKLPDFVLTGAFNSGFAAALMEKDVRIAASLADELGVATPVAHSVLESWHELGSELEAGADHTEIIRPLEERAEVTIRSMAFDGERRSA